VSLPQRISAEDLSLPLHSALKDQTRPVLQTKRREMKFKSESYKGYYKILKSFFFFLRFLKKEWDCQMRKFNKLETRDYPSSLPPISSQLIS
jgi:hypothetical protein